MTSAFHRRFWGRMTFALHPQCGRPMTDFAAFRRTSSTPHRGRVSANAGGSRHAQGGDVLVVRVEIVASVAFVSGSVPACAPVAETQETVETEAFDNPRPGVRSPYKSARNVRNREIGSGLLRVSRGFDFVSNDRAGVLQRLR